MPHLKDFIRNLRHSAEICARDANDASRLDEYPFNVKSRARREVATLCKVATCSLVASFRG